MNKIEKDFFSVVFPKATTGSDYYLIMAVSTNAIIDNNLKYTHAFSHPENKKVTQENWHDEKMNLNIFKINEHGEPINTTEGFNWPGHKYFAFNIIKGSTEPTSDKKYTAQYIAELNANIEEITAVNVIKTAIEQAKLLLINVRLKERIDKNREKNNKILSVAIEQANSLVKSAIKAAAEAEAARRKQEEEKKRKAAEEEKRLKEEEEEKENKKMAERQKAFEEKKINEILSVAIKQANRLVQEAEAARIKAAEEEKRKAEEEEAARKAEEEKRKAEAAKKAAEKEKALREAAAEVTNKYNESKMNLSLDLDAKKEIAAKKLQDKKANKKLERLKKEEQEEEARQKQEEDHKKEQEKEEARLKQEKSTLNASKKIINVAKEQAKRLVQSSIEAAARTKIENQLQELLALSNSENKIDVSGIYGIYDGLYNVERTNQGEQHHKYKSRGKPISTFIDGLKTDKILPKNIIDDLNTYLTPSTGDYGDTNIKHAPTDAKKFDLTFLIDKYKRQKAITELEEEITNEITNELNQLPDESNNQNKNDVLEKQEVLKKLNDNEIWKTLNHNQVRIAFEKILNKLNESKSESKSESDKDPQYESDVVEEANQPIDDPMDDFVIDNIQYFSSTHNRPVLPKNIDQIINEELETYKPQTTPRNTQPAKKQPRNRQPRNNPPINKKTTTNEIANKPTTNRKNAWY